MTQQIFKMLFIVLICFVSRAGFSQTKYVDLSVSQDNVEDCITNVETNFARESFNVFPNPTDGLITIKGAGINVETKLEITVFNVKGQTVVKDEISSPANGFEKQINLSKHPKGTYFLNINSGNNYFKAAIILE